MPASHAHRSYSSAPRSAPHRLAWVLACATFPLVWVGGLVTTYRAGMAVPDWPSTFGYWFYYPLESWFGVWDVFLEHSHRVIGMIVGLVAIALCVALWRSPPHRHLRWWGVLVVAGVSFQGALGGLRVIQNEVLLANVHGCTAPLFFSLAAAMVVCTSPRMLAWRNKAAAIGVTPVPRAVRWLMVLVGLFYLQIVLGAQMRHLPAQAPLVLFQLWVWLHLINAVALTTGVVLLWRGRRRWSLTTKGAVKVQEAGRASAALKQRPAGSLSHEREVGSLCQGRIALLAGLFAVQVVLGILAWLAKYGWPAWAAHYVWATNYTVVTGGRLQGVVTSAHVGVGSLCLVTTLALVLWTRVAACNSAD